jgi:hypothetical protein
VYKYEELGRMMTAFLDGDIEQVTFGAEKDLYPFLQRAIYTDLGPDPEEVELRANWKTNLDNIHWLLRRMSQKFTGDEYNAYKHGLRVQTGGSEITITGLDKNFQPVGGPEPIYHARSADAFSYLKLTDKTQDEQSITQTVKEAHKHFNALESLVYLKCMADILGTIKRTRLARITGQPPGHITVFNEINTDALEELSPKLIGFVRGR